jgi:hypothetical protein
MYSGGVVGVGIWCLSTAPRLLQRSGDVRVVGRTHEFRAGAGAGFGLSPNEYSGLASLVLRTGTDATGYRLEHSRLRNPRVNAELASAAHSDHFQRLLARFGVRSVPGWWRCCPRRSRPRATLSTATRSSQCEQGSAVAKRPRFSYATAGATRHTSSASKQGAAAGLPQGLKRVARVAGRPELLRAHKLLQNYGTFWRNSSPRSLPATMATSSGEWAQMYRATSASQEGSVLGTHEWSIGGDPETHLGDSLASCSGTAGRCADSNPALCAYPARAPEAVTSARRAAGRLDERHAAARGPGRKLGHLGRHRAGRLRLPSRKERGGLEQALARYQ